ncbi:redoxin family protein [Citrobacter braakii]
MEFKKSTINLNFGKDHKVRFGDTYFSLDKGIMSKGGRLPQSVDLVTPTMKTDYFIDGQKKTILTVPSLDTPVCEWQVKKLSDDLKQGLVAHDRKWYVVSVDTPFAQARFIRENNISKEIIFLSDFTEHRFMSDTGLRIKELNLFARAIIICDEHNIVQDIVVPQDVTHLP